MDTDKYDIEVSTEESTPKIKEEEVQKTAVEPSKNTSKTSFSKLEIVWLLATVILLAICGPYMYYTGVVNKHI